MKKTAERRFAMKEIEQDALRTAEDHFAESPSLEERVARIEARDRVEELLAHYARCVDAQDAQGVGAAFTEDGEMCNPGMPALKINGLGTVNVFLRWKLFCKDDIIFRYGNTADGHGIVSIGRYFQTDAEE